MPFFANTPEALVARSDSKNPATTCRGITSSGRPCRRPLAAPGAGAASLKPKLGGKPPADDPRDESQYCWQHKEQASLSAQSSPGPRASKIPVLEERTSLDTLADRLGLAKRKSDKPGRHAKPSSGNGHAEGGEKPRPSKMSRPKPKHHATVCCCFSVPVDEVPPPPSRPKPRPLQPPATAAASPRPGATKPSTQHPAPASSASRPRLSLSAQSQSNSHSKTGRSASRQSSGSGAAAPTPSSFSSQTAQYLSLIPASASPQTASLLMAELVKPVSQGDEPGYIYMFWLTPETEPASPPAEAARSLLAPPGSRPAAGQRRVSDVLSSYAATSGSGTSRGGGGGGGSGSNGAGAGKNKKILLKIGRANNVHRRLNEWTRQCGYNLSLIRYYPYIPSASASASNSHSGTGGASGGGVVPRKMPHSHKVERLIHLELAGAGLRVADRERCGACGREHREWFEVDASRRGVMEVDDVVRRWVGWDEGRG